MNYVSVWTELDWTLPHHSVSFGNNGANSLNLEIRRNWWVIRCANDHELDSDSIIGGYFCSMWLRWTRIFEIWCCGYPRKRKSCIGDWWVRERVALAGFRGKEMHFLIAGSSIHDHCPELSKLGHSRSDSDEVTPQLLDYCYMSRFHFGSLRVSLFHIAETRDKRIAHVPLAFLPSTVRYWSFHWSALAAAIRVVISFQNSGLRWSNSLIPCLESKNSRNLLCCITAITGRL